VKRTPVAVGVATVIVLAAGATAWFVSGRASGSPVAAAKSLSTAAVEQKNVVTYTETTATLGYTDSVTVSSPIAGTVTSIASEGDKVAAGSVVATVDGTPVVAMIGDVPGWRDLSTSSSAGIDIRQLETNLVTLGFDPGGKIVIDEKYDSATKAAVNAWKASLGLKQDGLVAQGLVAFVPGELQVDSASVQVGGETTAGGALLGARMTRRIVPAIGRAGATVSSITAPGTAVTTGTVLFRAGGLPVAAIVGDASAVPMLGRDLSVGVAPGSDVKLLEQMLAAGGFNDGGALVVDDTFDAATAAAVLAWWQSIDPAISVDPAKLVVPAGSFLVVPAGLEVGDATVSDGAALAADATVVNLTSPARVVTTTAPIGDATFALGSPVDVQFPDGSISTGKVIEVGTVATAPSGAPGQTPTIGISIRVDQIPASVDSFVSIPVTLRVVDQKADNAFVVPTSALVALAEGGYALEVVTTPATATSQAQTKLIPVKPTLYSDGSVVVTGDQVTAGAKVVVPS
jgi:peptidoglycan hydrolase-like protein with peptidoglycan-binding domain